MIDYKRTDMQSIMVIFDEIMQYIFTLSDIVTLYHYSLYLSRK